MDLRLFYFHVTTSGFLKVGTESEHMPEMDYEVVESLAKCTVFTFTTIFALHLPKITFQ